MTPDDVLQLFRRCGALLEGHFRLSSGRHSAGYLQCALVLQHPAHAEALGQAIGGRASGLDITTILAPALGGIVIGHEVGRALGVRAVFAERENGVLTLRRGFTLSDADRVFVVEDVITTGGSTLETIEVARAAGARVMGAGAIIDRSQGSAELGVPFFPLATVALPTHAPESCPLCDDGRPVTKPGSRPRGHSDR